MLKEKFLLAFSKPKCENVKNNMKLLKKRGNMKTKMKILDTRKNLYQQYPDYYCITAEVKRYCYKGSVWRLKIDIVHYDMTSEEWLTYLEAVGITSLNAGEMCDFEGFPISYLIPKKQAFELVDYINTIDGFKANIMPTMLSANRWSGLGYLSKQEEAIHYFANGENYPFEFKVLGILDFNFISSEWIGPTPDIKLSNEIDAILETLPLEKKVSMLESILQTIKDKLSD